MAPRPIGSAQRPVKATDRAGALEGLRADPHSNAGSRRLSDSAVEVRAMTQTNNRFLDEFAKLMTDAAGAAQGMRREFETLMKAQGERILREMDVVQREEFEAVKEMAVEGARGERAARGAHRRAGSGARRVAQVAER